MVVLDNFGRFPPITRWVCQLEIVISVATALWQRYYVVNLIFADYWFIANAAYHFTVFCYNSIIYFFDLCCKFSSPASVHVFRVESLIFFGVRFPPCFYPSICFYGIMFCVLLRSNFLPVLLIIFLFLFSNSISIFATVFFLTSSRCFFILCIPFSWSFYDFFFVL